MFSMCALDSAGCLSLTGPPVVLWGASAAPRIELTCPRARGGRESGSWDPNFMDSAIGASIACSKAPWALPMETSIEARASQDCGAPAAGQHTYIETRNSFLEKSTMSCERMNFLYDSMGELCSEILNLAERTRSEIELLGRDC